MRNGKLKKGLAVFAAACMLVSLPALLSKSTVGSIVAIAETTANGSSEGEASPSDATPSNAVKSWWIGGGGSSAENCSGPKGSDSADTGAPSNYFTGVKPAVYGGTWEEDADGGWRLKINNGADYAKNQWGWVAGKWYFFDGDGHMMTGWVHVIDDWYLLSSDGSMQTGWAQVDGKWYYLNPYGNMASGWTQIGDKLYYLDETGALLANTVTPDGYQVNESGERIQ